MAYVQSVALIRQDRTMMWIEFCQEKSGALIACAQAGEPAVIPRVGDLVYAPRWEDSGVYAYLSVSGRQFYYDQQGTLTMIRLTCKDGPEGQKEGGET